MFCRLVRARRRHSHTPTPKQHKCTSDGEKLEMHGHTRMRLLNNFGHSKGVTTWAHYHRGGRGSWLPPAGRGGPANEPRTGGDSRPWVRAAPHWPPAAGGDGKRLPACRSCACFSSTWSLDSGVVPSLRLRLPASGGLSFFLLVTSGLSPACVSALGSA